MLVALGEGEGRTKIAQEAETHLQKMLDFYNTGILITGLQLEAIDVPEEVRDAQLDVQNAKTEQEKLKNQAEGYRNDILPRARGDAQQLIQQAEGYKQAKISNATGDASRFNAIYTE